MPDVSKASNLRSFSRHLCFACNLERRSFERNIRVVNVYTRLNDSLLGCRMHRSQSSIISTTGGIEIKVGHCVFGIQIVRKYKIMLFILPSLLTYYAVSYLPKYHYNPINVPSVIENFNFGFTLV